MNSLTISVTHSPDAMKAFLYVADVTEGRYPDESELLAALRAKGIVFGVMTETIHSMTANKTMNKYIEAAQGDFPVPGCPGKNEILIDVSNKGKPRKLANGRVDHRDISYIVNVTKGTPLVKHIPPVPGSPGRTVFDVQINPPPVHDKPFIVGEGTIISSNDDTILCADINGDVIIHPNGTVEVVDKKTISGDIDYSTGNVKFSGDLRISGNVRAGFDVEVEGDCHVGGNVEDAKITCLQDLEIIGGAIGATKGCLKCGGSLKVRHIANFTVQAVDSIRVIEEALHCTMITEGNITAKSIVGGTISAWKAVEAEAVGTDAEPKTVIDLGGQFIYLQKKDSLLKNLASLIKEIGSLKEKIFLLVRDEMDENGNLHEGSTNRLDAMKTKHRQCKEQFIQVQYDIESVDDKLKNRPIPFLKAREVFPNTIIKFGTAEERIVEKLHNVRITIDLEKIIIGKY